jgi:hypothetical protein
MGNAFYDLIQNFYLTASYPKPEDEKTGKYNFIHDLRFSQL